MHQSRQANLLHIIAAGVWSLAFVGTNAWAQRESNPNVVLIVADDLGYGELGCYGQKWIQTPAIDRLAAEGIRFTQFYCGSPVCAPSRCVLLTGKSPAHAYIRDNRDPTGMEDLRTKYGWEFPGQYPIPEDEVTIAELFKSKGYATAAIGKWGLGHVGTSGAPNVHGFDLFFGYYCQRHAHNHYPRFLWRNAEKIEYPGNDGVSRSGSVYSQDEFAREALKFIRDHRSEPFFLYLPLIIPHLSIQVPEVELETYRRMIPEEDYQHTAYLKHPTPRAGYAGMITRMDRDVGAIVDLIEELGLAEDTLIVFTSDNGPTYNRIGGSDSDFFESTAGMRGRKGSVYEGGIRVPLIARWKNHIPAGTTTDAVAAFWDIVPTFCEIGNIKPPQTADGVSLVSILDTGKGIPQRRYLIWEFAGYGGQQAIRMGDWKGVRIDLTKGNRQLQLFNLKTDPFEKHNVSANHPNLVNQMKSFLASDRTSSPLFPLFDNDK